MLRQERTRAAAGLPEQSVAVQQQVFRVHAQKTLSSRCSSGAANRCCTSTPNFCWKYSPVNVPELHLKNELANHALLVGGSECAVDREHSLRGHCRCRVPIVLVLKVGAVDMRERSHAEADHVGAGPQQVAVQETACVPDLSPRCTHWRWCSRPSPSRKTRSRPSRAWRASWPQARPPAQAPASL